MIEIKIEIMGIVILWIKLQLYFNYVMLGITEWIKFILFYLSYLDLLNDVFFSNHEIHPFTFQNLCFGNSIVAYEKRLWNWILDMKPYFYLEYPEWAKILCDHCWLIFQSPTIYLFLKFYSKTFYMVFCTCVSFFFKYNFLV